MSPGQAAGTEIENIKTLFWLFWKWKNSSLASHVYFALERREKVQLWRLHSFIYNYLIKYLISCRFGSGLLPKSCFYVSFRGSEPEFSQLWFRLINLHPWITPLFLSPHSRNRKLVSGGLPCSAVKAEDDHLKPKKTHKPFTFWFKSN